MNLAFAVKSTIERLGVTQRYYHTRLQLSTSRNCLTHWNYEKKIVFVHIPKNAGTSVYRSMNVDQMPPDTHITATVYRATDPELFGDAYVFAFVRNPWDRFVSAFHYLKQGNHPNDDSMRDYLSQIADFSSFIEALKLRKTFRATVMSWLHFLPQTYFLCDFSGHPIVENVHRVERFSEGLAKVQNATGLVITPQYENRSKRKDFREYYTPDAVDLVRDLYSADLKLLDYEAPM